MAHVGITPSFWILSLIAHALAWNTASGQELADGNEPGFDYEVGYTLDLFTNLNGGVSQGNEALGLFKLAATWDLENLVGWTGARAYAYGLGIQGGSISERVGDIQAVSNIEAPSTARIYEAWLEQDLFASRGSLLVGLFDLNSEFNVLPSSGLFLNSSQGIGPEFGLSGRNGPSIFPVASLAARFQFQPTESTYAQFALLDGVPGDPHNHNGTHVLLQSQDGVLMTGEIGIRNPRFEKLALGVWTYTNDFDHWTRTDSSGELVQQRSAPGVYLIMEKSLFQETADPEQGLNFYTRTGIADGRVQPVDLFLGGGLVYTGAIPGRDADQAGCAIGAAHLSDEFQSASALGGSWQAWETAIELTYHYRINDWFSIQPDIQYIINPSGDPSLGNATVIGLRLVASF